MTVLTEGTRDIDAVRVEAAELCGSFGRGCVDGVTSIAGRRAMSTAPEGAPIGHRDRTVLRWYGNGVGGHESNRRD
jgi:hypothetical protein